MSERVYVCDECERTIGGWIGAAIHSSDTATEASRQLAESIRRSPTQQAIYRAAGESELIIQGHRPRLLSDDESDALRARWRSEGARCLKCGSHAHCSLCCDYGECQELEACIAFVFVQMGGTVGEPAPPELDQGEFERRSNELIARGPTDTQVRTAVEWWARNHPPRVKIVRDRQELLEWAREHNRIDV